MKVDVEIVLAGAQEEEELGLGRQTVNTPAVWDRTKREIEEVLRRTYL